ncbi:hypothetical protein BAP_2889 [Bacillus sp. CN2]|nr:hypothetical protein AOA15_12970 [Bacillus velezensis]OCJ73882.1 hypothetical protein BBP38_17560 [Bacillus velezensis]GFR56183.1 hypothetical protein BAP_2889 [Bacillus sp. CN2]
MAIFNIILNKISGSSEAAVNFDLFHDEREVYVFINFSKKVILFDELVKQNEFGCVLRKISCVEHEKAIFSVFLLFYDRGMDILREK